MRGGPEDHETPLAALRAFGADEETLAAAAEALRERRAGEVDAFPVLPCNWTAMRVFLRSWRQWQRGPKGEWLALDHSRVLSTVQLMGIRRKDWPDLFERIGIMEQAALEAMQ